MNMLLVAIIFVSFLGFQLSVYFIDLFKWMGYTFTCTRRIAQSVISGEHQIESIRIVGLRMISSSGNGLDSR